MNNTKSILAGLVLLQISYDSKNSMYHGKGIFMVPPFFVVAALPENCKLHWLSASTFKYGNCLQLQVHLNATQSTQL